MIRLYNYLHRRRAAVKRPSLSIAFRASFSHCVFVVHVIRARNERKMKKCEKNVMNIYQGESAANATNESKKKLHEGA